MTLSLIRIFELLIHNLCNLRSNKGGADRPCLSRLSGCEGRMKSCRPPSVTFIVSKAAEKLKFSHSKKREG